MRPDAAACYVGVEVQVWATQDLQIHNEAPQSPKSNPEINQSNDFLTSEQAQL